MRDVFVIRRIQREVAGHYGLTVDQIRGPRRLRAIAHPRQEAMWLARRLTDRSLPEIGRVFGGRDHATIMHGIRAVERRRHLDIVIERRTDRLEERLREELGLTPGPTRAGLGDEDAHTRL